MDLSYVKKLIKLVSESDVEEIEIEEEGKKIRIAKSKNHLVAGPAVVMPQTIQVPASLSAPSESAVVQEPQGSSVAANAKLHEVKSPIVGTFYRSPAPDASPFVEIGSVIQPGTVLCIIEAMKLMNEIESDVSGKIVKAFVESGQPVEYDQTLFLVEKP
ncbi:MAG: acetyl-CoA carboxylase biotin carboxyl carrier protein [Bacteroidota bacterium]